jgi:TRAP-type C4-dicarboxylate transport system permease small subunit
VSAETLTIGGGASAAADDQQPTDLAAQFRNIVNIALYIIGAVSVLMLIYGGIRYTVSGGDTSAVTAAKNTILYAIIGIVVALLAYAIVNFVIGRFVTS